MEEQQRRIEQLEERVRRLERTVAMLCRKVRPNHLSEPTLATETDDEPATATTPEWLEDFSGLGG